MSDIEALHICAKYITRTYMVSFIVMFHIANSCRPTLKTFILRPASLLKTFCIISQHNSYIYFILCSLQYLKYKLCTLLYPYKHVNGNKNQFYCSSACPLSTYLLLLKLRQTEHSYTIKCPNNLS